MALRHVARLRRQRDRLAQIVLVQGPLQCKLRADEGRSIKAVHPDQHLLDRRDRGERVHDLRRARRAQRHIERGRRRARAAQVHRRRPCANAERGKRCSSGERRIDARRPLGGGRAVEQRPHRNRGRGPAGRYNARSRRELLTLDEEHLHHVCRRGRPCRRLRRRRDGSAFAPAQPVSAARTSAARSHLLGSARTASENRPLATVRT